MDMYKLKFTRLQNEIFRLLCINVGRVLNQRAIAKKLEVSATAVFKALVGMEKEGFVLVKRDEVMRLNLVELNRDGKVEDSYDSGVGGKRVIDLKRVENFKMIYESGLVEELGERFSGGVIILFGSYSYGEDTVRSDIDIAVIGCNEKNVDLKKFEELLEREIRINFYDSFKDVHKNLRENLFNGIVLRGGIRL